MKDGSWWYLFPAALLLFTGWKMFLEKKQPWRRIRALEPENPKKDLWDRLVENGGCVHCDVQPKGFAEGPSGGMNTNVFCIRCGQGYNIAPALEWAQEIGKNARYVIREGDHVGS